VTANGIAEKVVSKLLPAEEDQRRMMLTGGNNTMSFGGRPEQSRRRSQSSRSATSPAGAPVTLTAGHRRWPSETAASSAAASDRPGEPISIATQQLGHRPAAGLRGVARIPGPRKVTFDTNPIPIANGKAGDAGAIQRPRILHADRDGQRRPAFHEVTSASP
jgi:hypothetical protein